MIDPQGFQIKEEIVDLEDLVLPSYVHENTDVLEDFKEEISEVQEKIKEKTLQISERKNGKNVNFKMNSEMAENNSFKSMKVKISASKNKETKQCGERIPFKQYGCFDCNKKFSSFDKMRVHAAWVHAKPVHLRKNDLSNEANIDLEELVLPSCCEL